MSAGAGGSFGRSAQHSNNAHHRHPQHIATRSPPSRLNSPRNRFSSSCQQQQHQQRHELQNLSTVMTTTETVSTTHTSLSSPMKSAPQSPAFVNSPTVATMRSTTPRGSGPSPSARIKSPTGLGATEVETGTGGGGGGVGGGPIRRTKVSSAGLAYLLPALLLTVIFLVLEHLQLRSFGELSQHQEERTRLESENGEAMSMLRRMEDARRARHESRRNNGGVEKTKGGAVGGDLRENTLDFVNDPEHDDDTSPDGAGRKCTSPEVEKPWIFDNCPRPSSSASETDDDTSALSPPSFHVASSKTSPTTCGFCNRNPHSKYFAELSRTLEKWKGEECQNLVVYSVAFGESYVRYFTNPDRKSSVKTEDLLRDYHRCFFTFVLEEDIREYAFLASSTALDPKRPSSYPISADHLDVLVPVPRSALPYENMRRNAKLFKMHGHLIFSFTSRLVWQDSKFRRSDFEPTRPRSYDDYFNDTVGTSGACAVFMGMPVHKNTVGRDAFLAAKKAERGMMGPAKTSAAYPAFGDHCGAIVAALEKRPTVTDSGQALTGQCSHYQAMERRLLLPHKQARVGREHDDEDAAGDPHDHVEDGQLPSLSSGLIDSAFIVWDLRSDLCRDFNADLACTWSDEIQCYSDRDQVSFPYALMKMGLREEGKQEAGPGDAGAAVVAAKRRRGTAGDSEAAVQPEHRFFVKNDDEGAPRPMVQIIKSTCHWYFGMPLNECDFGVVDKDHEDRKDGFTEREDNHREHDDRGQLIDARRGGRVAVLVAGSFRRFFFNSTVHHLIRPLVEKQGYDVDYYLSLVTDDAPAYRSDVAYMNHLYWDPIFDEEDSQQKARGWTGRPERQKPTNDRIEGVVRRKVEDVGGRLAHIDLRGSIDISTSELLASRRARARIDHPTDDDPDLRFPTLDIRSESTMIRTANANRNILSLHLAVQGLWEALLVEEANSGGGPYDYVMFLRDDTLWLADFDLQLLLRSETKTGAIAARQVGAAAPPRRPTIPDVYLPSCNARQPPMVPEEICDHGLVAARARADVFGKYFANLFSLDLDGCASAMSPAVRRGGRRGCNSEMILKWTMDRAGLDVRRVGQALIPFQRAAHVLDTRDHGAGTIKTCFHKFCQSHEDSLRIPPHLQMCKAMDI